MIEIVDLYLSKEKGIEWAELVPQHTNTHTHTKTHKKKNRDMQVCAHAQVHRNINSYPNDSIIQTHTYTRTLTDIESQCAMTQRGAAGVKAPVAVVSCHHLEECMSPCLLGQQH